jgi:hypothetical protein
MFKIKFFYLIIINFLIVSCVKEKSTADTFFYDNPENKLWFHKTKTLEQLQKSVQEFPGVEFDVVFGEGTEYFDVRYTGEAVTGIDLIAFFGSLSNPKDNYFWVDFKNLSTENVEKAIDRLKYVVAKFDILENIIIESRDHEALGLVSKAGFFTCYWVPHGEYTKEDLKNPEHWIVKTVRAKMKENKFHALSGDYKLAKYLTTHFPEMPIHIWTNGLTTEDDKEIIKELAKHENIKVILVDYEDNFLISKH